MFVYRDALNAPFPYKPLIINNINPARKFNTPQDISNPTHFLSIADVYPIEISWDEIVNIITTNNTVRENTFKAQNHHSTAQQNKMLRNIKR